MRVHQVPLNSNECQIQCLHIQQQVPFFYSSPPSIKSIFPSFPTFTQVTKITRSHYNPKNTLTIASIPFKSDQTISSPFFIVGKFMNLNNFHSIALLRAASIEHHVMKILFSKNSYYSYGSALYNNYIMWWKFNMIRCVNMDENLILYHLYGTL